MQKLFILQNLLLPSEETCTETALYYRSSCDSGVQDGSLHLPAGSSFSFDTYFNSFSAAKWQKYTFATRPVLILRLSGQVQVTLFHQYGTAGGEIKKTILAREVFRSEEPKTFTFPFPVEPPEDLFAFSLKSTSGESVLYSGGYGTQLDTSQVQPVKLAVNLCTYCRESFVEHTLLNFSRCFLDNPRSPLFGKMEIFVSDNAGTLPAEKLASDKIHIFQTKNAGGVGGFVRGLLEIQKQKDFTHILFHYDDIAYEPEAVFRTFMFLTFLRPEYADAFIGGALLQMDKPFLQMEAGALWNDGNTISLKSKLDLRRLDMLIYSEREEKAQYCSWWFCVIPADVPSDENLPIPIFVRGDDAEYGLRNMKQLITLNGIAVWREPAERRYSSFLFYYTLRNRLIVGALHGICLTAVQLKREMEALVTGEVRLYRYRNAELILDGVEDFLRGVEWLAGRDGAVLHQKIMEKGYRMDTMEQLGPEAVFDAQMYETSCNAEQPYDLKHRFLLESTLNGTYLPPERKYNVVPCEGVWPISVYRTELVLNYERGSKRGFMTRRDKKQAKEILERMKIVERQIDLKYEGAVSDYAENGKKLWTREFWEEYLALH